jgi:hypothetical protein
MKTVGILRSFTLTFLTIAVALLFLMRASPAAADNCLQNEFTASGATQKLSCTANDVRIAAVENVRHLDGSVFPACNLGETISFLADFLVVTSSKSSRSNIGLYFGTAAQGTALNGTCTDSIVAPQHPCPTDSSILCGSNHYDEFDPSPDNCGDSSSTDPTVTVNGTTFTGAQIVTVEIDNFLCQPPTGQTKLVLPNCTSWQVPGSTVQCVSPPSTYPYEIAAVPGSPSKCNCGLLPLNLQIQTPTVSVTKNCTTANGSGTIPVPPSTTPASCTLTPEGGSVTYTVDVKNTANFGSVTLNQLCDSAYGNITTTNNPTCAAGSQAAAPASSTCALPQTIAANGDYSCAFTVNQGESKVVTNTVSATGAGASGGSPFGPTNSNTAQVTSNEVSSSAAYIKTSSSATPSSGCATVRYNVQVNNSSLAGSDESETLSALSDSVYGNIASVQGNVLGTTCGQTAGQGTLTGTPGPGLLPATIAVGGNYACQFDAKVCGTTAALTNPPNATTCAAGLETKDTVSGTIVGDESEVVSQTPGSLTVDVCFSTTEATQ